MLYLPLGVSVKLKKIILVFNSSRFWITLSNMHSHSSTCFWLVELFLHLQPTGSRCSCAVYLSRTGCFCGTEGRWFQCCYTWQDFRPMCTEGPKHTQIFKVLWDCSYDVDVLVSLRVYWTLYAGCAQPLPLPRLDSTCWQCFSTTYSNSKLPSCQYETPGSPLGGLRLKTSCCVLTLFCWNKKVWATV